MSVVVQYVVRPNPGTDPDKITELAKEGAASGANTAEK